jgi:hypothetical protein
MMDTLGIERLDKVILAGAFGLQIPKRKGDEDWAHSRL